MNATNISHEITKRCNNSLYGMTSCRDDIINEYLGYVKKDDSSDTISDDSLRTVSSLRYYEKAILRAKQRNAVWPQFIKEFTQMIEENFADETTFNISFETFSANVVDVYDWDNIVRIIYSKVEFDDNIVLSIQVSEDRGLTFEEKYPHVYVNANQAVVLRVMVSKLIHQLHRDLDEF